MTAYDTDRAASEVVGAVIVFSFLVIAFSVYQGVVIPDQNRAVEIAHNQAVQESMQDLRNAVRGTASTGAEAAVSVRLGADYPRRTVGINPGVSGGSLQTVPLGGLRVENVTATDPEVRDHIGGPTTVLGPFETKAVVYRPVYSHYAQAPLTSYENSLAVNRFPGGVNLTLTDQSLVDGRVLTLVVLNGSLSHATQEAVTVDTEAISTSRTTVTVTNDTGPLTLVVPTQLSAADWRELLADELDEPGTTGRYVTSVSSAGPGAVAVALRSGVRYELRLALVGVGSPTTSTDASYLAVASGDGASVVEGATHRLVAEARDRFNNPVDNVTVSADVVAGPGTVEDSPVVTGPDGRATFVYRAPDDVNADQAVTVNATFGGGTPANRTASFDLTVVDSGGGSTGGTINPGENGTVLLASSTIGDAGCGTGNPPDCNVTVRLNNTAGTPVTIESVRYNFYGVDKISTSSRQPPDYLDFDGTALTLRGPYTATDEPLAPGLNELSLRFYENAAHTNGFDVVEGDFFIVSVQFDDGRSATYFVAPS